MVNTFEDNLKKKLLDPKFAKMFGAAQAKSSFAITLVEARKQLNLTQQQLANRLGVSQSYIAKLEGGEANPTLDRIGSLLAAVGLSLVTDIAPLSPYSTTSLGGTLPTTSHEDWSLDDSLASILRTVPTIPMPTTKGTASTPIEGERELITIR